MPTSLRIEEIDRNRPRSPRFYDRFFAPLIRDERDLAFIDLILKATFFFLPFSLWILCHKHFSGWLILPYYAMGGLFLGPFILMLHCTSHRTFFKKEYSFLNGYIPWILSPFFGLTPETYYVHHIGMHHPENNMEDDLSSTLRYRRDCWTDFLKYFSSFLFLSLYQLPQYFMKRKRSKMMMRVMVGEISFYLVVALLFFWNWKGALVVFILPVLITRFMMMNGNWAQHAFVDPAAPSDNYKNSITCMNSVYNRRCFNDGYHIIHHLKPTCHWTEMPQHLQDHLEIYAQKDAVIFEKIDYFVIWIFLMLKRYDWLAKYFVDLKEVKRSPEEIMAFLKSRTQPVLFPS